MGNQRLILRTMEQSNQNVIQEEMDRYKGVIVNDMALLADTEADFDSQLATSLDQWKTEGARSIQIFFKPPKCHLMNVASKLGFYFHHSHKKDNYVLMCLWVDEAMADRLPAYADHFVGVGGIMVNDNNEVLMIQERRSMVEGAWKFPGGFVDNGETVKQGVEREVFEETGVKGEFQGILAMREQLDYKYGAADFYIVCVLRPHPTEQQVDVQDTQEIKAASWIPLSEITTNEEGCKYKLFPNAFQFMRLIKQWLAMNGKDTSSQTNGDAANSDMKVTDLIKM